MGVQRVSRPTCWPKNWIGLNTSVLYLFGLDWTGPIERSCKTGPDWTISFFTGQFRSVLVNQGGTAMAKNMILFVLLKLKRTFKIFILLVSYIPIFNHNHGRSWRQPSIIIIEKYVHRRQIYVFKSKKS